MSHWPLPCLPPSMSLCGGQEQVGGSQGSQETQMVCRCLIHIPSTIATFSFALWQASTCCWEKEIAVSARTFTHHKTRWLTMWVKASWESGGTRAWGFWGWLGASKVVLVIKNPPANVDVGSTLGQEDPLEEGMATYPSILVWRISWTEQPCGLQSIGWQRVRHNWSNLACRHS